jgi:hypothetical protein
MARSSGQQPTGPSLVYAIFTMMRSGPVVKPEFEPTVDRAHYVGKMSKGRRSGGLTCVTPRCLVTIIAII